VFLTRQKWNFTAINRVVEGLAYGRYIFWAAIAWLTIIGLRQVALPTILLP